MQQPLAKVLLMALFRLVGIWRHTALALRQPSEKPYFSLASGPLAPAGQLSTLQSTAMQGWWGPFWSGELPAPLLPVTATQLGRCATARSVMCATVAVLLQFDLTAACARAAPLLPLCSNTPPVLSAARDLITVLQIINEGNSPFIEDNLAGRTPGERGHWGAVLK